MAAHLREELVRGRWSGTRLRSPSYGVAGHRPVVRRIVGWTNNVASGKDDRRQSFTKAEFVEGGTVGKAKK